MIRSGHVHFTSLGNLRKISQLECEKLTSKIRLQKLLKIGFKSRRKSKLKSEIDKKSGNWNFFHKPIFFYIFSNFKDFCFSSSLKLKYFFFSRKSVKSWIFKFEKLFHKRHLANFSKSKEDFQTVYGRKIWTLYKMNGIFCDMCDKA